jgi:hypothetical protein
MQDAGRGDEAECVRRRVGCFGHLGAVGAAMEDREGGDDRRGDGQRRLVGEGDAEAEHHSRKRDAGLDGGQRDADHPEGATERHDEREGDRQHPDRRGAEEHAPEADGDHGDHVVGTEDRMREAADEAPGRAVAGMGQRRRGQEERRGRHGGEGGRA